MEYLRQIGTGILIAIISIAIILGGYTLATSEGNLANPIPAATQAEGGIPANSQPLPTFTEISGAVTATLTLLTAEPSSTVTAIASSTASTTNTPSSSEANCQPPAGWVAIMVGPLDSLASIARTYQMSQDELVRGNCLTNYVVVTGKTLYVRPALLAATQVIVPPAACGAPAGWVDYYVAQGDTLYNISIRYRIAVTELQRANCLGSSTNIRLGQKLKVPYVLATTEPIITPTIEIPTPMPPTDEPTLEPTPVTVEPTPVPPTEVTPPTEIPSSTPVAAPDIPTSTSNPTIR